MSNTNATNVTNQTMETFMSNTNATNATNQTKETFMSNPNETNEINQTSDWKKKLIGEIEPKEVNEDDHSLKIIDDKQLLQLYGCTSNALQRPYMVTLFDENEVRLVREPYSTKYQAASMLLDYVFNPEKEFSRFSIEAEDSLDCEVEVDGEKMSSREYNYGKLYERNSDMTKKKIIEAESGNKFLEEQDVGFLNNEPYLRYFTDAWSFVSDVQKTNNLDIFSIVTEVIYLVMKDEYLVEELHEKIEENYGKKRV